MTTHNPDAGRFDPVSGRPIIRNGACPICGVKPPEGGDDRCRPPQPTPHAQNGH